MEKEIINKVNKQIKKGILIMAMVGLLFGGATGVLAYQYSAKQVIYTPSDTTWKVGNVEEAIDSLKFNKTSDNYSTDEKVVGTWIDNKPIYQKTVVVVKDFSTGDNSISHGIANFDSFVSVESYAILKNGSTIPIPSAHPVTAYLITFNDIGKTNGWLRIGSGFTDTLQVSKFIFTIRYTKTSA